MRDPSPLRFAQPRRLVASTSAERDLTLASGSASKVQYREPRAGLAVSSSNDQLRFDEGAGAGGNSSTEEGSRRGSVENGAALAPPMSQRQRQLSASNTIVLDSPIKKAPVGAQFSLSKPLGRPPPPPMVTTRARSGSRAKRPAASMMMGTDEDDDACMGGDEAFDSQGGGHPMPDLGGRMRLSSGRADESDSDDDDTAGGVNATPGRSAIRPLSFTGQLFSPAVAAANASPRPDSTRHQRALTEHDLNKPVRSSGLSKSGSHSSHASYGSASKLLADEDNIFLESAAEAARTRSTTTTGLFSTSTSLGRSRSLIGADGKAPVGRSGIISAIQGSSAIANSKKAVSMDNLQVPGYSLGDSHGAESSTAPPSAFGTQGRSLARSRRTGVLSQSIRAGNGHKRGSSQDCPGLPVTRPAGTTKSISAQNLSAHLAAGSLPQSTSLNQLSTSNSASLLANKLKADATSSASSVLNRSAPATYNRTPDELDALAFNDAKPLLAAFTAKQSLGKKFKPRDSGVSINDSPLVDSPMTGSSGAGKMLPPAAPHRQPVPLFLPSRLSTTQLAPPSSGDEMDLQELLTPAGEPSALSGWPGSAAGGGPSLSLSTSSTTAFNFLGPEAAEAMASAAALHHSTSASASKAMPDTPVKTKSFGGGGGGATHPHPLSLASIRAEGSSSGSSSPSAPAGPSTGLPPLGSTSQHHSLNVLARSHRPSDVKPPHLRPLAMGPPALPGAGGASPAPSKSLIPKRSMTFRPKPSSLQARFTATSPESQTGSSSPPSGAESPTFLRRVGQHGFLSAAAAASPRTGALAGMPRPVVDGQQRMSSLLRRTSSGVSGMSGSESESGVEMTPTRRGPDTVARSTSLCFP